MRTSSYIFYAVCSAIVAVSCWFLFPAASVMIVAVSMTVMLSLIIGKKVGPGRWLLASMCLSMLFLTACSGFDALANTIVAVLQSINVILATLQAAFPAPLIAAIEAADTIAQGAVDALKAAYDNFIKDKTGARLLAALQAAVQAVKDSLVQILAAAHIDNTDLQSLITKIVVLVQDVIQEVETAILPQVVPAMTAYFAGNHAPAIALNERLKQIAAKLRADHSTALIESGLPGEVVQEAKKFVDHKLAKHIGPIRI